MATRPTPNAPPPPNGFPDCYGCPYLQGGSAAICRRCAARTLDHIVADCCQVCSQILDATTGRCPNWLCHRSSRSIARAI